MGRYCPSSYTATLQRIQSLGCDQIYKYHCMRNKKDVMVEKCIEISWIQEGKCAVYDTDAQLIDSWKCNGTRGVCPQKQYLSNEVMSYSACVPLHTPTNVTDGNNENTSKIPNDGSRFDNNNSTSLSLILGAILALIAVMSIFVITWIYIHRRRPSRSRTSEATKSKQRENVLPDPEEGIPLTIGTDVSEKHESTIEETRHDIDPYYKTRTFEYIEKLLEDSAGTILIIGHPGSGKSVLVEMLHDNFRRKDGNESLRLNCLEDINCHHRHEEASMTYFVDDCFEEWNQYPHLVSNGLKQFHNVHNKIVLKGKQISVVITMSKWNFDRNLNAIGRAKLLHCDKLKVIDLTTSDFELDITDKTGILEYHRKRRGSTVLRMADKEVRKVTDPGILRSTVSYLASEIKLEFEFQLSCRLFYSHDSFVAQKEDFFSEAKHKVMAYVRGLKLGSSEEKSQYCTLIHIALCGGKIPANKEDFSFLKNIAKAAKLCLTDLHFNYGCCLVIKTNSMHEIIHDEITQLLFSAFGYAHTAFVIDNCEVEVLLKYVRTEDKNRREDYFKNGFLVLKHTLYGRFFKRLQHLDKEKFKHIIFKDTNFYRKLRKSMKEIKNGETEL